MITYALRQKSARSANTFSTLKHASWWGTNSRFWWTYRQRSKEEKREQKSDFISTKLNARNSTDNSAATLWGKVWFELFICTIRWRNFSPPYSPWRANKKSRIDFLYKFPPIRLLEGGDLLFAPTGLWPNITETCDSLCDVCRGPRNSKAKRIFKWEAHLLKSPHCNSGKAIGISETKQMHKIRVPFPKLFSWWIRIVKRSPNITFKGTKTIREN